MKKLLSCMAIVLAVALTMTSCKKDEDTDSEANRLKFTNKIFHGESSLTYTWEGREVAHVKNEGVKKERYAVLRFKRELKEHTFGTGRLVAFTNSYKDEFVEASDFRWYFSNDCLYIEWKHAGWQTAHAEYRSQELVIDGNGFYGKWFESTSYWWEFKYTPSSWDDWEKYANRE